VTEADYVQKLIRVTGQSGSIMGSDFGWVLRPWRGLAIYGGTERLESFAHGKRSKTLFLIDSVVWTETTCAAKVIAAHAAGWARQRSQRSNKLVPFVPVDGIPWEIHAIEDLAAYLSALEAYSDVANAG